MSIKIQTAHEVDLEIILHLNEFVQRDHAVMYPEYFKYSTDPSAVKAFFRAHLSPPNEIAIAWLDRAPAGYIWFRAQAHPETPFSPSRKRVYVQHISVAPEVRRRGIATALMRYVERKATAEGIDEIALDTWEANSNAHQFFASQGFVAFNLVLHKKISTGIGS